MPAVNDVGEPCAGEPHARFDGRGLETERYGVTAPVPDPTSSHSRANRSAFPASSPNPRGTVQLRRRRHHTRHPVINQMPIPTFQRALTSTRIP